MVDNSNPTNQFHPYQRADATPHSEEAPKGMLESALGRVGLDPDNLDAMTDKLRSIDVRQSVERARDYARSNPALVLGGLAVAAIGAGLLRKRHA